MSPEWIIGLMAVISAISIAISSYVNLAVKADVADIRREIAENRRHDEREMRQWVEDRLRAHSEMSSASKHK